MNRNSTVSPTHIPILLGNDSAKIAELFLRKQKITPKPKQTEAMKWGLNLESAIIEGMMDEVRSQNPLLKNYDCDKQTFLMRNGDEWFWGYADGIIYHDDTNTILEAKSTAREINLKKEIPIAWQLQCQAMMMMHYVDEPIKECYLGCLSQTSNFSMVKILPDTKLQDKILAAAKLFKKALDEDDITIFSKEIEYTSGQLDYLLKSTRDKYAAADLEIEKKIETIKELHQSVNRQKENIEELKRDVKAYMSDAVCLFSESGIPLAKYTPTSSGKRILRIVNYASMGRDFE